jgi:hypothetical protein
MKSASYLDVGGKLTFGGTEHGASTVTVIFVGSEIGVAPL